MVLIGDVCERCKKGFAVNMEIIELEINKIDWIEESSGSETVQHRVYYHPSCFIKEHWKFKMFWLMLGMGRKLK